MAKSKELTVYKNELNTVPFRKFNSVEMDLFFAICSQMRNKGLKKIKYSFEELKELSKYTATSIEKFVNDLDRTYTKMLQLNYRVEEQNGFQRFVLFNNFKVDTKEKFVEISVNPDLEFILNEITGNFTKFELEEFTELRSSYSKSAFRLLKQFRQTGFWKIPVEDFRELLDIPVSYRIDKIDVKVLAPIKKELSPIFKNLQIKKIKAKKSNKIEYLEFKFKAEDDMNNKNEKTFRDSDGNYYQKDLFHLTPEEENKAFPTDKQK